MANEQDIRQAYREAQAALNDMRLNKTYEQRLADFTEALGCDVTYDAVLRDASEFDWNKAAMGMLSSDGLRAYREARDAAMAEYKEITAPALEEFRAKTGWALAEYNRAKAALWFRIWEAEHAAR